jgi:phosphonate degradation associated HDIG domain protein
MLMARIEDISRLFQDRGDSQYGGECVTQAEHALQSAALAESEGARPGLIVAALLHDIGHLLHHLPDDAPDNGVDDRHETVGVNWLRGVFPPDVTEPVRMHVDAKRYLCAIDPDYFSQLSPPSVVSLKLQGGPMSPQEVAQFQANPFAEDAVRLRRWDDTAKIEGLATPPFSHFAGYFTSAVRKGSGS